MNNPVHDSPQFRFSITELFAWMAAVSVLMALPYWFGSAAIQYCFYGTLAVVTWRLSRVMPTMLAAVIGILAAALASAGMVTWLQA